MPSRGWRVEAFDGAVPYGEIPWREIRCCRRSAMAGEGCSWSSGYARGKERKGGCSWDRAIKRWSVLAVTSESQTLLIVTLKQSDTTPRRGRCLSFR
uniref:Uncharacterized protein n=1 Tax=Ascaris lumbricoides TaxID=6252 RepID=A0A0M3I2S6_ASCLU